MVDSEAVVVLKWNGGNHEAGQKAAAGRVAKGKRKIVYERIELQLDLLPMSCSSLCVISQNASQQGGQWPT